MGRRKIPVDKQQIARLYRQGYSTREIADKIGVSHDTVLRRLKEIGQPLRSWRLPGER
ncbi:MAG: helix-turn-helix domain-containing protein [Firmicutes bacterium]|jgi:transposase-like protein|nr:helix-turn-helix domain-containing protein [Bacillota bacterium]